MRFSITSPSLIVFSAPSSPNNETIAAIHGTEFGHQNGRKSNTYSLFLLRQILFRPSTTTGELQRNSCTFVTPWHHTTGVEVAWPKERQRMVMVNIRSNECDWTYSCSCSHHSCRFGDHVEEIPFAQSWSNRADVQPLLRRKPHAFAVVFSMKSDRGEAWILLFLHDFCTSFQRWDHRISDRSFYRTDAPLFFQCSSVWSWLLISVAK